MEIYVIPVLMVVYFLFTERHMVARLCLKHDIREDQAAIGLRVGEVASVILTFVLLAIKPVTDGTADLPMVAWIISGIPLVFVIGGLSVLYLQTKYSGQYQAGGLPKEMERELVVVRKWLQTPHPMRPIYVHAHAVLKTAPNRDGTCIISVIYDTEVYADNELYLQKGISVDLTVHFSNLYKYQF